MEEFKKGVYHVLSLRAMHNCSYRYAEARACGMQQIDIDLLRKHTDWACVSYVNLTLLGLRKKTC